MSNEKYPITATYRWSIFNDRFSILMDGKTCVNQEGEVWRIINSETKFVTVGRLLNCHIDPDMTWRN